MEISWEEPPKTAKLHGHRSGQYADLATQLESRPGVWAKVPMLHGPTRTESSADALAQNIRRGVVKGFKKGCFETASEGSEVWVRYVEPPESPLPEPQDTGRIPGPPPDLAPKVRLWAKREGIQVPDRGRLSAQIIDQYLQEYPEDARLRVVE